MAAPWRVLVVDDDAEWRFTISVYVDPNEQLALLGATSLAGARAEAEVDRPDAVVIDVGPPGESGPDGLDALLELRRACPEATIYVYTDQIARAELALAHGADAVVDKATPPRTLLSLLAIDLRGD